MITQTYFDFFYNLNKNNNREWFNDNKKTYERDVKEPFLAMVEAVVSALEDTEPELGLVPPKQMLFRINRDTRFSKDKRPYKEHLGAVLSRYGTKDKIYPGHYLQVSPFETFIAGGAYFFEEKEMLNRVRYFIANNAAEFDALINDADFKQYWIEIKGEKNKRLPSTELTEAASKQPLIYNTQFYWGKDINPQDALKSDFIAVLKAHFKAAQPLNHFLKEAMYGG